MGFIRWVFAICVLAVWTALIGTALYVAVYEPQDTLPEAAAIVVLSGATNSTGGYGGETSERVTRGVQLFQDGLAERLILSGGASDNSGPIANAMATAAREAGVPDDAILIEDKAKSTLQNALFVADLTPELTDATIILVTQRYHLPRAMASFRWAGFSNVVGVAADAQAGFSFGVPAIMESVKWPYNIVRAAAASAAMAGDVPRESYIDYLQ